MKAEKGQEAGGRQQNMRTVDLRETSSPWVFLSRSDNTPRLIPFLSTEPTCTMSLPLSWALREGRQTMQNFSVAWNLYSSGDNKPKKCKGPEAECAQSAKKARKPVWLEQTEHRR